MQYTDVAHTQSDLEQVTFSEEVVNYFAEEEYNTPGGWSDWTFDDWIHRAKHYAQGSEERRYCLVAADNCE